MALAHFVGKSPIECFYTIIGDLSILVKCCDGTNEERNLALQQISKCKNGIILDYTAVISIFELNLSNLLQSLSKKLYITQSTIDAFEIYKEEQKMHKNGYGQIYQGKDGKHYKIEISPEQIQNLVNKQEAIIKWLKNHCNIITAKGSINDNIEDPEILQNIFGKSTSDTIIESQTRGLLVYCDDYLARLFSQKQGMSNLLCQFNFFQILP